MFMCRQADTTLCLAVIYSALSIVAMGMAPTSITPPPPSGAFSPSLSCAVVGVGALGTSLCKQILQSPDMDNVVVTGITKTDNNHERIRQQVLLGSGCDADRFSLLTAEQAATGMARFDTVIFCAPPSGFEDYPKAVQESIDHLWKGPTEQGLFVFTSSGAVYGPGSGETVTETTPTGSETGNPRVDRLVKAEQACLQAGGCCLRLAGLYSLQRGPHHFWLTSGKDVNGSPQGIVNLLHYDDAAAACIAAVRAGPSVCRGEVFLIGDGNPMTREGICQSALRAQAYSQYRMPTFISDDSETLAIGKVYDGSVSNRILQWKPVHRSFDEFISMN